ncbi:transposase [Actinoplanes sp. Pm04-4]|uniref:Transposase n=1 Tax=Paractinoplanes pyxinae TaxID=2997416 RepID=A0ABT4B4M3_9ACTN|nr:transposase [Actinoplanes pyxinae]MCY1141459.1 transposase [Actinoplanes pyxinae]
MARVIIGVDPHKRSATIEVINERERTLAQGRFGTDRDGYQAMLAAGRKYADRQWAVEGCKGIGRHVAQRLVADGETVVDVPAKLSARARVFSTGQGRKTDPVDAHSVAVVVLRTSGLQQVTVEDTSLDDLAGEPDGQISAVLTAEIDEQSQPASARPATAMTPASAPTDTAVHNPVVATWPSTHS